MQVKNITTIEFVKRKNLMLMVLKTIVSVLCIYFIYFQFQKQNLSIEDLQLPRYFYPVLFIQFPLMILNWYLDIYRWKISVEPFENIKIKEAVVDVLGGLAMNWISPFATGDLLTRIAAKKDKYKAFSAILLNRGIMLSLTLGLGIYGILAFMDFSFNAAYVLAIGIGIVCVLFLLKKFTTKLTSYFFELRKKLIIKIFAVSLLRYFIFLIQFLILLKTFLPEVEYSVLVAGIGWIFLVRSSIPSFLGGLGLRETSAFFFFQGLAPDLQMVVFPVFILWIINTVIPSVAGVVLIWNLRIKIAG